MVGAGASGSSEGKTPSSIANNPPPDPNSDRLLKHKESLLTSSDFADESSRLVGDVNDGLDPDGEVAVGLEAEDVRLDPRLRPRPTRQTYHVRQTRDHRR